MLIYDMLDSDILGKRMNRLAKAGLLGSLTKIQMPICENCLAGKASRKPFGKGN